MRTPAEQFDLFDNKARAAVGNASAASQHVIRREAATWERAAEIVRAAAPAEPSLDQQLSLSAATAGLICAARGIRRAIADLQCGRADDARHTLTAILSGADAAIEHLDALVPGASSLCISQTEATHVVQG